MSAVSAELRGLVNYSELFLESWRLAWQNRVLWLLGALTSLGSFITMLVRLYVASVLVVQMPSLRTWQALPEILFLWLESLMAQTGSWFVGGLVALFVGSLVLWLIITTAEGGLIVSVLRLEAGQPVGWRQALEDGRALLARFIGVDTLLFFPLFLLVLLSMLLLAGMLVGVAILTIGDATLESALRILSIGSICLVPLLCLLLPVTVLTMLFRTLAFRDIVIGQVGVRRSIRRTWWLFRRQAGLLLVLFALLWGIGYLANTFVGLLGVPLFGLIAAPGILAAASVQTVAWTSVAAWFLVILYVLISFFVQTILHAYTATVWTVACQQLTMDPGIGRQLQPG